MIKSYGIPGESQETRTELEIGAPYILMKFDRPEPHYIATESGEWVEPEDTRDYKHFKGRDKQGIFNDAEKRAIYTAAYSGPDIDIDVLMLVKEMDNAEYVTYSDQSMVLGLQVLEAKGLISPERHQEIIVVMTAERQS